MEREKLDVEAVRRDFPMLATRFPDLADRPLVYLDSAATAQKPRAVLDTLVRHYEAACATIHRGVHALSVEATRAFEAARARLARFVGARDAREVVFVRGTTEAINLVADSYGRGFVPGDEIIVSELEHHSNLVPWQLTAARTGARLRVWPMDDGGELPLDGLEALLGPRTRLVAVAHVSNALGTVNPIGEIAARVHRAGAVLLVDGAQGAPHLPVDVQALGCDFYAFSGHKLYGPTGIGVLWGRQALLEQMPPYQGGGDMIESVRFDGTTYLPPPHRFEAGTPAIAEALALAAAVDYLDGLGRARVVAHEAALIAHAVARLAAAEGVRLVGAPRERAGVVSFLVDGVHPHDLGTVLDREGIAIRTGHHCAQPVMAHFGVPATARLSVGLYNTVEEIDLLVDAVERARRRFQ
jgi:cysteine desulfurase/selenocysteine lyase